MIRTRRTRQRTVSYLRVSTLNQDVEKNKAAILSFANERGFGQVEFIEETASGAIDWKKRKIGGLINDLKEGDRLIVPELSRLGRSMLEIMTMLQTAKEKGIVIYDVKNRWELDDTLQSKIVAAVFGIAAEIERELIRQRTGEGLAAAKAKGVKFGRPQGPGKSKLDPHRPEIIALLQTGSKHTYIAKRYGATSATLGNWLKKNKIDVKAEYPKKVEERG